MEVIDLWGFIYITTNMVNGKKYIGQRKFTIKWKAYLGSGIFLKESIKKYGRANFSKEIVALTYSKEESDYLEKEFIKNHNAVKSDNYYNLSSGGGVTTSGRPLSEETKEKIRQSKLGLHHTEETKRMYSINRKGIKKTESAKQKQREKPHKISKIQVFEIRNKYATGKISQRELSEEYSVCLRTVARMINYESPYDLTLVI